MVQDHVAATFGSGLAAACVVDVGKRGSLVRKCVMISVSGDQKVSVSCVEDGVSQPNTRIQLGYGDNNDNDDEDECHDDAQEALT